MGIRNLAVVGIPTCCFIFFAFHLGVSFLESRNIILGQIMPGLNQEYFFCEPFKAEDTIRQPTNAWSGFFFNLFGTLIVYIKPEGELLLRNVSGTFMQYLIFCLLIFLGCTAFAFHAALSLITNMFDTASIISALAVFLTFTVCRWTYSKLFIVIFSTAMVVLMAFVILFQLYITDVLTPVFGVLCGFVMLSEYYRQFVVWRNRRKRIYPMPEMQNRQSVFKDPENPVMSPRQTVTARMSAIREMEEDDDSDSSSDEEETEEVQVESVSASQDELPSSPTAEKKSVVKKEAPYEVLSGSLTSLKQTRPSVAIKSPVRASRVSYASDRMSRVSRVGPGRLTTAGRRRRRRAELAVMIEPIEWLNCMIGCLLIATGITFTDRFGMVCFSFKGAFQLHAVWHMMNAMVVMFGYFYMTNTPWQEQKEMTIE